MRMQSQEGPLLHLIIILEDLIEHILDLVTAHVGQETQSPGVDTQDRDIFLVHPSGGPQEGAITSDAQGQRQVEIIIVQETVHLRMKIQFLLQESVKTAIHIDHRLQLDQLVEQPTDHILPPNLIFTAKNPYLHALILS